MVFSFVLFVVVLTSLEYSSGFSNVPRIVGGLNASSGEFPFMVSLQKNEKHICGGTIINSDTVLTAGHCAKNNLTVKVGTHDLTENGLRFNVKCFIIHPNYETYLSYDVALLKIDGTFTFGPKIRPIVLEDTRVDRGIPCISCGWGQLGVSNGTSQILKYVELTTVSSEVCHVMFKAINAYIGIQHICTLEKTNKGVCYGDSGGPLINLDGRQIGIVSFVRPCAIGFPDVFIRISHFYSWINENM